MLALATEATLFSVAGSITSKRALSEDLRHLPPIHRSVGTLASRLSYLALMKLTSDQLERERLTVSAMRSTVGSTMSSRASAAGSGIGGAGTRPTGPSRS